MREPFAPPRNIAARPERALDRVWLGRVQHLAARDDKARREYLPPWCHEPEQDAAMTTALADLAAAGTEAEAWAASAAWSRAFDARDERWTEELRAERETIAPLRRALDSGTDADLARLAQQTGGAPAGGRAEIVAALVGRARDIAGLKT